MKQLIYILTAGILCHTIFTSCHSSKSATKDAAKATATDASKAAMTDALNKNEWVFSANVVIPQSGHSRSANDLYTVTFSGNKLVSNLPYFGRAYSASFNSTQGPLDFQSTDFDLNKEQKKTDQWVLTIKPKDYREVQTLYFTFFDNGSANLDITLTNRTPISFRGTVAPKK